MDKDEVISQVRDAFGSGINGLLKDAPKARERYLEALETSKRKVEELVQRRIENMLTKDELTREIESEGKALEIALLALKVQTKKEIEESVKTLVSKLLEIVVSIIIRRI